MSQEQAVTAKCLCGAAGLGVDEMNKSVGACHCDMCRKWGGGPYMSIQFPAGVSLIGEENIGVYTSSDWAERGFCKTCGSHLFYRLRGMPQYFVPAGLFAAEDLKDMVFSHQVFVDQRPHYYQFANQTHEMTAAEVFAEFGSAAD